MRLLHERRPLANHAQDRALQVTSLGHAEQDRMIACLAVLLNDLDAATSSAASGPLQHRPVIDPGTYSVKLSVNGKDYTTKVVVEADPGMAP